ncbi:universal stress protein [Agrilactobacillus fermenti]|uniref:universal stress protein n=1 Tax=Agrilactobacillus fermenti TaxID=2586909 RepID=UPI001E5FF0D4|nr:universal stress protein [Agrilactobacillus fermenti]MCD2255593.1 universal stress protein [Agrilactobacillus fermenti]
MTTLDDFTVQIHRYNRILVTIDSDDFISSKPAFEYACTTAKMYQIPLGIVSILETGDLNIFQTLSPDVLSQQRADVANLVDTYADKAREFGVLDVTPYVSEGKPGRTVVDQVIPEFKPDLLVVGSERKANANAIGSQASYMVRYAPCSVIVVRN